MLTSVAETTSSSSATGSLTGGTSMGKEDFLQLLVAQLQNQDPLNPQDPTEFTAQLSQFSSLEQLFEVNNNLEKLSTGGADMERVSALSMIGKEVVAESGDLNFEGQPLTLGYRLDQAASEVSLQVTDMNNILVAEIPADQLGAGSHFLSWDGSGLQGETLSAGDYRLSIKALGGDGQIEAQPLVKGQVSGVDLDPTGSVLVTSAGEFALGTVRSVEEL